MATNFEINSADLAYILRQIKIGEASSIGYTPEVAAVSILQAIMNEYGISAVNAAQLPAGLRTVDGTFNNLVSSATSEFGAADTLFPRLTDPVFQTVDGPGIDFNGDGIFDVVNHNYGDASATPGYQIRSVADADPRTISNLIVDMSVNNPAAIEAFLNNPLSVGAFEEDMGFAPTAAWFKAAANVAAGNEWLQTIPNLSPDIGLSPGFNSWMTFFGQFFDHGLDLVTKGSNGTVYIPLSADDPLYDKGKDGIANNIVQAVNGSNQPLYYVTNPSLSPVGAPPPATSTTVTAWAAMFNDDGFGADGLVGTGDDRPNFMALTRATATLDANGIPQHENTTTSWIDQNQTYTSHSSHQVFLREYVKDAAGHAVSTGRLIDGTAAGNSVAGAIGNWGEVKAQAKTMLGIILGDFDIHNVPLLLTDQYGKFIPGANGYAQLVMAADAAHNNQTWLKEGTAAGITTAGSLGTGHAFLNDIAHHAAPAIVDHDHNPGTPGVAQTADLDIQDVDRDGLITQVDITANNKDVNRDGLVNAADLVADDGVNSTYDDEMLNAHFITGDGRGNENIALTTVHSIFHSEHNRIVEATKATLLADAAGMLAAGKTQAEAVAFLNEWLVIDRATVPVGAVAINGLTWDGERLFQAARFGTEMQYQHLVFEEFARRIQPMVEPFVFNNSPNIDPSIVAEFAHTVYRFGHSMLTGTVDRLDNNLDPLNGDADQQTLLAVFLNPQAYLDSGADLEEINANLIRGLSRDVGNGMDEFIVTDVRSNLLGLPLDLGALNIARGRDTGIPSLNEARRQLYDDSGLADLKPYESWVDFAANLKNAASVVNFIAAYGTHGALTAADVDTLAEKRAVAEALVFGGSATINAGTPQQRVFTANQTDRLDFVNARGAYAGGSLGGLNLIDLWIGGLAEANPEFGGMLGTTFNYVFEAQMENLQNGDRMYYLTRTQGQNFLNQLEPNTFADLVMRNTDLGDKYATHLNGALFTTPDLFLELDRGITQTDYSGSASDGTLDPDWADGEPHSPFNQKVARTYSGATADGNHDVGGTMRYIGGQHVVMGGTEGDDKLYGDRGIDTLWGDGGNDYLNAGTESDDVFGGEGDDVIEDPFGDDLLRGNEGNDVISSARGADILFGNQGSDAIFIGQDASEVFAGSGNDFVLGGAGGDVINGNEGDDWLEGGAGFDTLIGDNSELFFNSLIIGHDVMFAHADEVDYDAESGDDIMGSGPSVFRYEGMFGFDWGIGKGDTGGVAFNLLQGIFTNVADDILRDRFDKVEALSGYQFDDILEGDQRGDLHVGDVVGLTVDPTFVEDLLTQEGIDRIDGFGTWFGNVRNTLFGGGANSLVGGTEVATSFRDGNILLGGDGNDLIRGRGGFDLIDGDAWLNARIGIEINGQYYSAESMNTDTTVAGPYAGRVYRMVGNNPDGDVNFAAGAAFGGASLQSLLLNRTINPGQMSIVREIKYDATNLTGALQNYDTAVFNGTLAEYDIEGRTVDANGMQLTAARDVNLDGFISVHDRDDGITGATVVINGVTTTLDSRGILFVDDTDFIKNIEELQFADQTLILSGPHTPKPPALDLHAFDTVTTTVQYRDNFTNAVFNNSNGTTAWNTSWVETGDGTNTVGGGQIQTDNNNNDFLRFIGGTGAAFDGASITRTVDLSGHAAATVSYNYGYVGIDPGETLTVLFAADGVNFEVIHQVTAGVIDDTSGGGTPLNFSVGLTGPFATTAAIRFTTSGINTAGENFRVDNVAFNATTTTQVTANDGLGFTSTFTEDGPGARIALNSAITDPDSANMAQAQVRLTNAQALDVLSIAGGLPAGITSSVNTSVAGVITLTLSGTASRAAYQTAIEQVRYSSTSQNPSVTPRTIEVTVRDAQALASPVVIATVNVVAVNDAPVAVADLIITNIATGNIVIAESALLGNDTDPDGNVLDVTAVSGAAGVNALSLATNPGSVTLADDGTPGGSFIYTASDGALSRNASVTLVNQAFTNVADNFNGVNPVRSAANNSTGASAWATSWIKANDTAALQTGQIQIDGGAGNGNNDLRFAVGDGGSIQRGVNLSGATAATLTFDFDKNGIDVGEFVDVEFAADGVNFVTLSRITNDNGTNANGNAAGTSAPLALTGAIGANSVIRFTGSAINTAGEDIRIENVRIDYALANATVTGTANGEILVGDSGGSIFNALGGADRIIAGGGNDTINAGGADDTIIWSVGDGRDFVDGGGNGTVGDRFVVNGDDSVEDFKVYTVVAAAAAGISVLNATTEIVVTRNGAVVAELDNVEEITINTAGGTDLTAAIGNFGPTSLFFNTVTVNGGTGPDTIDASQLTSAHRLVLNQGGTITESQPAIAPVQPAAAPAQPATGPFPAIGQSLVDALGRQGLLDSGNDGQGFLGARQIRTLAAELTGDDYASVRHYYDMFRHHPGIDHAGDHGSSLQAQALHFDAADNLIS